MPALLQDPHNAVDPDGLLEYSVVYTDRALNHMSKKFQRVMNDISATLKGAYGATTAIIVPGSGTFGMEAVARQFASGKKCLIIRNGFFSFRWSQILDMGRIAAASTVLKARPASGAPKAPFAPAPLDEVLSEIRERKPNVVFAPHVETASGIVLPDDYLKAVAEATHAVGGLFVLDCVASGALWVDMRAMGVDVLVSAPQKGWSGPPCAGLVMLGEQARARIADTISSSFACDLRKWMDIMAAYEGGGAAYHATMPTDALAKLRDVMQEAERDGLASLKAAQWDLGKKVRALLAERGFPSVAAPGFEAPGVVVSYADEVTMPAKFAAQGIQVAAGVPLQCDEPADFKTFRIGLFGLDKLRNVDRTVKTLEAALDRMS
ncbi:MAG TPA: aminotransferase class V-fold PLP-dependent enzyme [Burkholderiales bacterium]|nr:aminotransferase class V-fold PLP-dependent enzyme [Burkholderiales bacterium]